MKRLYYYFFYKIYRSFGVSDGENFNAWKAGLMIQTLQLFILAILYGQIKLITKGDIIPHTNPKIWAIPLAIFLALFNYYTFLHHNRWKKYAEQFKNYPKRKNIIAGWITFFIILLVVGILIFTYYQFSQVDWKKYR